MHVEFHITSIIFVHSFFYFPFLPPPSAPPPSAPPSSAPSPLPLLSPQGYVIGGCVLLFGKFSCLKIYFCAKNFGRL